MSLWKFYCTYSVGEGAGGTAGQLNTVGCQKGD